MKITAVRGFLVTGAPIPGDHEIPYSRPLSIYPEYGTPRHADHERPKAAFIQIDTDEGASGIFGPLFEETAFVVLKKLAPVLVGQDPLATEYIWDVLYRADRHSRKGYEMMAISVVDCALWDLKGKVYNQPVYRLLGGPTRQRIDCYASMSGHSLEPAAVRAAAQWAVEQGYRAQKWFLAHGPREGLEGMEKNVAVVKNVREAVGPNVEIMLDAVMGWDVSYAIRFLQRVEEYHPLWLEEPVHADQVSEFATVRQTSSVPISTGEHEYTRWGFLQLLKTGGVDVVQSDPDWCGGVSELVKICTLASAFGRKVIPHGHSLFAALNVIAAQSPATCPMAEFLILTQPTKQHFFKRFVQPENGSIPLPTAPGLGIEIGESKVERRVEM